MERSARWPPSSCEPCRRCESSACARCSASAPTANAEASVRLLKQTVCVEARQRGAIVVVSRVDKRNEAMLRLNTELGALLEPDPRRTGDVLCFIAVN